MHRGVKSRISTKHSIILVIYYVDDSILFNGRLDDRLRFIFVTEMPLNASGDRLACILLHAKRLHEFVKNRIQTLRRTGERVRIWNGRKFKLVIKIVYTWIVISFCVGMDGMSHCRCTALVGPHVDFSFISIAIATIDVNKNSRNGLNIKSNKTFARPVKLFTYFCLFVRRRHPNFNFLFFPFYQIRHYLCSLRFVCLSRTLCSQSARTK